jgi:hypothetical protein
MVTTTVFESLISPLKLLLTEQENQLSYYQQSWWFICVTPSKGFYYGQTVRLSHQNKLLCS